ncbi:MAG: DUF1643 domain-containing protein [Kineosporiaceae bacterium]|nr:DUF1643 domain-containing protein [Kineosporiaceae bacterium]MBK8077604.1 DUF1643 domain-containing protein [Kineosporiaceae bacterium]
MTRADGIVGGTLGAILLNPPLTAGTATVRHLRVAADLLGCAEIQVANLFAIPTKSVIEINVIGSTAAGWEAARPSLAAVLDSSTALVAGWGVSGLHGQAAAHQREQLSWIAERVAQVPVPLPVWTLNGESRHPSRWHQYVSERHGRAIGNSFQERLASVLRRNEVSAMCMTPAPLPRDCRT